MNTHVWYRSETMHRVYEQDVRVAVHESNALQMQELSAIQKSMEVMFYSNDKLHQSSISSRLQRRQDFFIQNRSTV